MIGNSDRFKFSDYCVTDMNGDNRIVIYNTVDGFESEDAYKVEVSVGNDWHEVPVYYAEVTRKCLTENKKTYFASVELDGKMYVRVTPKNGFESFKIRPYCDIDSAKYIGLSVEFSVNKPMQLSVEFDGDVFSNLQLFVNEIEKDLPNFFDENVIFFPPKLHTAENCEYITLGDGGVPTLYIDSGKTVYISGGAVVKATVKLKNNAQNVKVCGRGIIDVLPFCTPDGMMKSTKEKNNGQYPVGIRAVGNKNVSISGIIIRNSCGYAVMGNGLSDVNIKNIKLFNRGQCSDGIDFVASKNVNISDCYIRSNDDGIAIYATRKGWADGFAENFNVTNCVFMTDCAHAINIGTHGSQDENARDEIRNIKFSDIDILDVYEQNSYYWGAIGFTVGDENYVHDVTFENVRMYPLANSKPFHIAVQFNKSFNPNAGYRIENILFKDVKLIGKDYNKSFISGYGSERAIDGITFDNLTVDGVKITDENAHEFFDIGEFVNNVSFK